MAFSFGSTNPAPPAAPPGGFSLGGAAAAPATTPGFSSPSFGAAAAAAAAAASSSTPAPATAAGFGGASGFSFGGGGSSTTPASGGTAAAAAAAATTTTTAIATTTAAATAIAPRAATLQVPAFDSIFQNLQLWHQVQKLLSLPQEQDTLLAGQEWSHFLSTTDHWKPKMVEWTAPNHTLRQQLAQNPTIECLAHEQQGTNSLPSSVSSTLTPLMLQRILQLATDLRIPEAHAVSLYAEVAQNTQAIQGLTKSKFVVHQQQQTSLGNNNKYNLHTLMRDFYFQERHLRLQTLLLLVQSRLSSSQLRLEATDFLLDQGGDLAKELIQVIRDYTMRIQQLQQELASTLKSTNQPFGGGASTSTTTSTSTTPSPPPSFAQVHLRFCQTERHVAAETLFFMAYHTQLFPHEMAALLDLIRDLTADLVPPSPFANVPSPYMPSQPPPPANTSHVPPYAATTNTAAAFYYLQEKQPWQWQHDFVTQTHQSGQPQLLQCVSLLVVAAMAAMDTQQILYDRQSHGPNAFGKGNKFLPPDHPSLEGIREIDSRLNPSAPPWARPDIQGVLAASYALLLQAAPPATLTSPKAAAVGSQGGDMRQVARDCLESPVDLKSFTFCRLTLIPALQRLPKPPPSVEDQNCVCCNVSEFGLAVLAETYSRYLKVMGRNMPISRYRWEKEENEGLDLARQQQIRDRQFQAWSGNNHNNSNSGVEEVLPATVDLVTRPDCMDDLIALATAISHLGPDFSRVFWETDDDNTKLVPHPTLQNLERIQAKDDSLLPSYLSWLAALANDEASANAVNEILLARVEDDHRKVSWMTLIFNLRWYAQELSPYDANDVVSKNSTTTTTTNAKSSTSYYYNLEGNSMPNANSTTSSTADSTSTTTTSTANAASQSAAVNSNQPKELSELSRFRLTSHLAVIRNVARHSSMGQNCILKIALPVGENASLMAGGDEALLVLFKLAIAPLSPQVRGATLSTIASLLLQQASSSLEDESFLLEQAKNAWEYLEACPLLPIRLLDQYLLVQHTSNNQQQARVGLAFAPSSTALAATGNPAKSILPNDPNYGIIYEMEYIETKLGWYPSTEGFLEMLTALVKIAGCPKTLGQNWRMRTGCAPYLEYVVDCILPRILGLSGHSPLPFRIKGDQSRLIARALEFVEAIMVRYSVPAKALKLQAIATAASPLSLLGIQSVVDQTTLAAKHPALKEQDFVDDFKNISTSSYQSSPSDTTAGVNTPTSSSSSSSSGMSIPCTKSPGFSILADLLSSGGGILFQAVARVLTDDDGPRGIAKTYGSQADNIALAFALFGAVPPDMESAKEGAKEGGPSKPLQTLLKPILPETGIIMDPTQFDDAVSWREQSIVLALRILCAAAAQEEQFVAAVASASEPLKIVPVLRFQHIRFGSSNFKVVDVNVSRLTNLLFSASGAPFIRGSVVEYIGYNNSSSRQADLAAYALSLMFFMHQTMSPSYSLVALCGNESETVLSQAVATRLLASSKSSKITDTQTVHLILNWILSDLRLGRIPNNDGIVQVLLGLPSTTVGGKWKPDRKQYAGSLNDCFDAILELVKDVDYATATCGITSFCLEIVFRLYDLLQCGDSASLRIVLYAAERLRAHDFWRTNLLVWLSTRGLEPLSRARDFDNGDPGVLNCIAWLLKGLACELKLLVGFANNSDFAHLGLAGHLAPQPQQCNYLLSLLFGSDEEIAKRLIEQLPLDRVSLDANLIHPPLEVLKEAVFPLPGPSDVMDGYEQVNAAKVMQVIQLQNPSTQEELDSYRQWADQWNASAAWTCAASHLCNATFCVLNAALISSEYLRSNGAITQIFGLQANGLSDLLGLILTRLEITESQARHHGMDAKLIPTATCSLGNAALLLSDKITGFVKGEETSAAELLTVASLLSRVIEFSSKGDDSAVEAPTRYERTTVLSSALSLLLRHTSDAEPGFVRQYREDYIKAARALEKMSSFKVDSSSSQSFGIVSVVARATFGSLVVACSDEDDTREESFVFSCMTKAFLTPLLDLVKSLDENVCCLLQTVALQRYGAEILINSGICNALKEAAMAYIAEETRVQSRLKGTVASYNKVELGTPGFLLSHLKLLSALLSSTSLPEKQSSGLAIQSLEVMGLYKGIVRRLCYNFPTEADVLRCFMRCFVQAASLTQSVNVNEKSVLLSTHSARLKELFSEFGFVENGILILCQQLWENPLSRDLLPSLPPTLSDTGTSVESSVVSIQKDDQKQSWWDVLDSLLSIKGGDSRFIFNAPVGRNDVGYWGNKAPPKWNENKFEYSIVATDILSLGLSLLKRLDRFELLDGSSIARGLFNCAYAAQAVESRLEEVRLQLGNSTSLMVVDGFESGNIELEAEYLTHMGKLLARCVEELLVISNILTGGAKENGQGKIAKQMRTAIEQSGLEVDGLGCLSTMNNGEQRQELVSHFCSQIKKEST